MSCDGRWGGADDRFLAFAAVQMAALGALAGVVAEMTLFVPMTTEHSGPAAIAAAWLVRLLLAGVALGALVANVLPESGTARESTDDGGATDDGAYAGDGESTRDGEPGGQGGRWVDLASTVAAAIIVVALACFFLFVAFVSVIAGTGVLSLIALACALGILVVGGLRWSGYRLSTGPQTPFSAGGTFALVGIFVAAFLLSPVAVGSPTDHVARYGVDVPESEFAFEYEAVDDEWGVVTITHVGGEPADPESLMVGYGGVNESYPDDADVDQDASGQWGGQVTGPPVDDGSSGTVVERDTVQVAVPSDCRVHVLHHGSQLTVLGSFTCPDYEPITPQTPAS